MTPGKKRSRLAARLCSICSRPIVPPVVRDLNCEFTDGEIVDMANCGRKICMTIMDHIAEIILNQATNGSEVRANATVYAGQIPGAMSMEFRDPSEADV